MAKDAADIVLMKLMRAIIAADTVAISDLLKARPAVAKARLKQGAARQGAKGYYFDEIGHYVYAGDTALHVAAASYQGRIASKLIAMGADVRCRNRRGAEPLHYAADGVPGSHAWKPNAQAAIVTRLIEEGADPNALDKSGVTPLHRAVRTRCAAAVNALLEGGADPRRKNGNGSTPMQLATQNTGRGGSGTAEAKAQQEQIVRLLEKYLDERN